MRFYKKKVLGSIKGKKVKSAFELEVYNSVLEVLPEGATVEYEVDKIPYTTEHVYIPDLTVTLPDGRKLYIEAKGNGRQFDQGVKSKMIAVKQQHPDKPIYMVFYADGKCGPKRKNGTHMRQSDWAEKHGFIYSIKKVIKDWFT